MNKSLQNGCRSNVVMGFSPCDLLDGGGTGAALYFQQFLQRCIKGKELQVVLKVSLLDFRT